MTWLTVTEYLSQMTTLFSACRSYNLVPLSSFMTYHYILTRVTLSEHALLVGLMLFILSVIRLAIISSFYLLKCVYSVSKSKRKRALQSPKTLPTMYHSLDFCIITCQTHIEMTPPIRHLGTHWTAVGWTMGSVNNTQLKDINRADILFL